VKIRQAHGMDYGRADDGTFVLIFLDERGAPFATATMSEEGAEELADFLDDELLHFDSIGEVAGHA
jgi:hypothetical protein